MMLEILKNRRSIRKYKDKKVESIISIGYPDEERPVHKIEDLKFDKVYRNKYGL